jgi:two-component sensor histidine kinase
VGAVAGVGRWAQRHLRRARLVDAINTAALSEDNEGTFLYQPDHTLEPLNERARYRLKQWIDLDTSGASPYPVDALAECCPGIAALCTTLRAQPPESVERSVETDATGPLHATAQMLPDAAGEDGYGLIVLQRASEPNSNPAWGLMARRVAHDLKNPLTSILLTLQRLQMEYRAQAPEASSDLDVYTERIENRIARLRRMTKNFMKFVDAEEPQFTTIRLNVFLKDQEGHLAESIPPDTDLIVRYADANPSIAVDVDQMQSVLENLIANAVNAMPNGGRITVSAAVERDLLWDADTAPRDAALIEVMDTGTGMDAETRRRLFEPGFTTRDNGTGLGLAIVRKVISDHDGTIEVESEPGTGSVFCIYLPLQDPDTAA